MRVLSVQQSGGVVRMTVACRRWYWPFGVCTCSYLWDGEICDFADEDVRQWYREDTERPASIEWTCGRLDALYDQHLRVARMLDTLLNEENP